MWAGVASQQGWEGLTARAAAAPSYCMSEGDLREPASGFTSASVAKFPGRWGVQNCVGEGSLKGRTGNDFHHQILSPISAWASHHKAV